VERSDFYLSQNTVICVAKIYNFPRSWKSNFLQRHGEVNDCPATRKPNLWKKTDSWGSGILTSIYTSAAVWDNWHSKKKILTSFFHL